MPQIKYFLTSKGAGEMSEDVLRGLKEALLQEIESHHAKVLDAVDKYDGRVREELLHRPVVSAAAAEPKQKKPRGTEAPPTVDRNKELKRLTNKYVKEKDLKDCFTCATKSVECKFRKSKVKDNVAFTVLKQAFTDTADQVSCLGIVPMELHPFWLCGNHRGSKNIEIDMSKLAAHYLEFCEALEVALDERVYERLKEADKTKRAKVSDADDDDNLVDDDHVVDEEPMEIENEKDDENKVEHFEDDENHADDQADDELQLEEDVEPDRADPEDMMKVFELLKPHNLRRNIDDYKLIYTTACPIQELQIVLFDDKLKICVGTELPDPAVVADPELYIGFYSPKYTDAPDASPTHGKTRWVPCLASLFVEAGETEQKAQKGVEHFVRLAKQMLDRKHRNP